MGSVSPEVHTEIPDLPTANDSEAPAQGVLWSLSPTPSLPTPQHKVIDKATALLMRSNIPTDSSCFVELRLDEVDRRHRLSGRLQVVAGMLNGAKSVGAGDNNDRGGVERGGSRRERSLCGKQLDEREDLNYNSLHWPFLDRIAGFIIQIFFGFV